MAGYRSPYTIEEQRKIVRYIVDKKKFYSLRGVEFWQNMQNQKILNRTWQSAKEHFRKQIIPMLHDPRLELTAEEIEAIKVGYNATDMRSKNQPPTNKPITSINIEDILDPSDDEV